VRLLGDDKHHAISELLVLPWITSIAHWESSPVASPSNGVGPPGVRRKAGGLLLKGGFIAGRLMAPPCKVRRSFQAESLTVRAKNIFDLAAETGSTGPPEQHHKKN